MTHNLGFGRSIIGNEAFAAGEYSTAFIPTYYPDGFRGDPMDHEDLNQLMVAQHFVKN